MTDKYAVIGNPVEHSLSPDIHAAFARETGQDLSYGRLRAPLDGFSAVVAQFRNEGGSGLNVTLPFKHEAWRISMTHSPDAANANAVNTIQFVDSKVFGHNTDGIGLVRDLQDNLGCPIQDRRVLVMGAGGAAYGVTERLLRAQPGQLVVANRTVAKAQALVERFKSRASATATELRGRPYDALGGGGFDVVINATSAGLTDDMPALPADVFAPDALAYDMVYGKKTPFLKFAAERGIRAVDGLGMLVEQAAESFFIWRGVRPSTKPVIDRLRRGRMNVEG